MCSRVLIFLIGAVFVHCQVVTADAGELMVEGNITMNFETILPVLNVMTNLQVNTFSVTISQYQQVAECLINGPTTNCNCSTGYTWSNDVCYNYSCCSETTCYANVSSITSLCIPKVTVQIYGSLDATKTTQLQNALQGLNGFQYLRINSVTAEFEAAFSVKFPTVKLQEVVNSLTAAVKIDTSGMVNIRSPKTTVCSQSSPVFICTFEEETDSAAWNIIRMGQRTELNVGSVVKLNNSCTTPDYKSCTGLTLQRVTGTWEGTYECGFTKGSIRHTAKTNLSVALLPDVITMVSSPLTADCTNNKPSYTVDITATITQSTENYRVQWMYNNAVVKDAKDNQFYIKLNINCQIKQTDQTVTVTFINSKQQNKSEQINIPVLSGSTFCVANADWPNTPLGATVINRTCAPGTVGSASRTCDTNGVWQAVINNCVNEELNKISNAAKDFLDGLGATQEMAKNIFTQLNSSTSASSNCVADISASINILSVMSSASKTTVLNEEVLPNFINAASNMLNSKWNEQVNNSVLFTMSSTYLQSVEGLVKNININNGSGVNSTNLDLKFCPSRKCNVTLFDIGVNINMTNGTLKFVAVKKLTDKLKNSFKDTEAHSLLLSATLENNNDSSIEITLDFPNEQSNISKRSLSLNATCVFWNTTTGDWSDKGCIANVSNGNYIKCTCSHLTTFSVLMSKDMNSDTESDPVLNMITCVGLGVSIVSLLIFLFIESLVWSALVKTNLSHFRHTCLVNIATFLLLADACFLASEYLSNLTDTWCLVLAICKHLFFLAMFCWMLCMSVMLVHQLVFVFSPVRKKDFMFLSSIVGYVFPMLIVGSSYAYCKYTNKQYYNIQTCWLVFDRLLVGSVHAFLLPVGTVVLTNLFCMMVVIFTLMNSSVSDGNKANKDTAKSMLKVVVFLTPVFGITWIFGLARLIVEQNTVMFRVMDFCFIFLNSFQGFFIFVVACFSEQKVREELLKVLTNKSKRDNTSATITK